MAAHRSPRGRRAYRNAGVPAPRHLTAPAPAPHGPSLRTTVLVSAVAVGSVATGTFTALLPTPDDGGATSAAAGELSVGVAPAAQEVTGAGTASPATVDATSMFAPISFAAEQHPAAGPTHLAMLDKATEIATQIAELHAEQARVQAEQDRQQAERDRLDAVIAEGGVDGWIAEALRVMDLPQSLAPGVKKIIMKESGGNPKAINNWDSNARRGTPSEGLMQTIPSTYRAYVHPDLKDEKITHPVANITAGVRYMIDRWGMDTLEQGGRRSASGGYLGY